MGRFQTLHAHIDDHWHLLVHPARERQSDAINRMIFLCGIRILALAGVTALWIGVTLWTGFFTVAPVMFIGAAVGSAHLLMRHPMHIPHFPSALAFTLLGGVVANVLAGLAEFSANAGVAYTTVLMSRQFPEDLSMIAEAFVSAFRIQDALYYLISVVALTYCIVLKRKN